MNPFGSPAFAVDGLTAGYGTQPVVFDVSLAVNAGTVTALIGPNGAGKSTLLKSLFGLTHVFAGKASLNGVPVGLDAGELVRRGVAYVPQMRGVFPNLSVRENLELGAYVRGSHTIDVAINVFPELSAILAKRAGKLSGGQRNMVAVGRALMSEPSVLLLDEASGGLAPLVARRLWEHVVQLADSGIAIVAVEQNVRLALEFSSTALLLTSGRVTYRGSSSELLARSDLEQLFLEARPEDARTRSDEPSVPPI